jgi:hypothetical protein
MKRTIWTMAATGLIATCMTTCGGGKDYVTDICNRLKDCGSLSLMSVTTVSQCVTAGNQQLSGLTSNDRSSANKAMDQCLATSDCTSFKSCMSDLIANGPSSVNTPNTPNTTTAIVASTCSKLQSCNDLSQMDVTTVAQCTANANQQLSQVPSSELTSVVQMLNQCLAQSDCATFTSCINALNVSEPSTVSTPAPTSSVPSDTYVTSICNRLQTCGDLSMTGASTVSQCMADGNQAVATMTSSQLVTFYQTLSQCLAQSDCTSFESCVGVSDTTTPTPAAPVPSDTYVTAICNRLQTCGDLSMMGASTVSQCTATANQSFSGLTSSQMAAVDQTLSQCLALSDCTTFESCIAQ